MILYNINTGKEVLYFKREDKIFDTLNLGLHTNKETGKLVYVKGVKYDCDDVVYELYNISYDEEPSGDRYCYVSSLIETISQSEFFKKYKSVDLKDMILKENNMKNKNNYEVYININTGEKIYVDKNTIDHRGEYPVYNTDNKLIYHIPEIYLNKDFIKYDKSFKKYISKAYGTIVEAKPMKARYFPNNATIKDLDKDGYCINYWCDDRLVWIEKDKFEQVFRLFKPVSKDSELPIKNTEECSCGKSCICNKEETEDQQLHQSILDEIHKLYISKNKDYGNSFSKLFKEFDLLGTDYMLTTKMNRFKQLSKGQVPNNESIRDTLMDLANYAILTIMELDSKED